MTEREARNVLLGTLQNMAIVGRARQRIEDAADGMVYARTEKLSAVEERLMVATAIIEDLALVADADEIPILDELPSDLADRIAVFLHGSPEQVR